jgi:hypothetical protein
MSIQFPAEAVAFRESPSSNIKELLKSSTLVLAPIASSVAILNVALALLSTKFMSTVSLPAVVLDIITLLKIKDDWAVAVNNVVAEVDASEVPVTLKKLLIVVTSPLQHVGLHLRPAQSPPYGTLTLAL